MNKQIPVYVIVANGGHEHTIWWWIWVRNPFAALAAERHDVTLTIHMPTCLFCPNLARRCLS